MHPGLALWSLGGRLFQIGPVKDYIKMLCENAGLKLIVFAHFHIMMDSLSDLLHDLTIKFIRIDGHTPQQDRPVSDAHMYAFTHVCAYTLHMHIHHQDRPVNGMHACMHEHTPPGQTSELHGGTGMFNHKEF